MSRPKHQNRKHDPRAVALQLFRRVTRKSATLDEALAQSTAWAGLAVRDRAFARLLVATLLRRLGQLDALIDHCLRQPLKPRQADLRDLLRLGTAQLVFLETPPHAAVSTSLALAESHPRLKGQKPLLNAVLRRLAREGADLAAGQDAPRLNTPDWLWNSWQQAYGEATARDIAAAHLVEPPLDLTVKADAEAWAERLGAEILPTSSLRIASPRGEVARLPGFGEGAWWVQDAAAASIPRLLGSIAGQRVIDLCAAPGGKTAALAAAGAKVIAVDRAPERLARLRENLDRLQLSAELVAADATSWRPAEPAAAVLLDAPCSATGTLRRHPDIARLRRPEDVAKLAALQARLLENAIQMLSPGGLLVYAVCSLQPEEGRGQVERLRAAGAPLERAPIAAEELAGLREAVTPEGDLQTLPCQLADRGGMDGFFACRLRRL